METNGGTIFIFGNSDKQFIVMAAITRKIPQLHYR